MPTPPQEAKWKDNPWLPFLVFAVCGLAATGLAWPARNAFFLSDDISGIYVATVEGGWLHCFQPMANGFWRPIYLLLTRSLVSLFGLTPAAFHRHTPGEFFHPCNRHNRSPLS